MKIFYKLKAKSGFTLIECLVAIMVFAVLSAIVVMLLNASIVTHRDNLSETRSLREQRRILSSSNAVDCTGGEPCFVGVCGTTPCLTPCTSFNPCGNAANGCTVTVTSCGVAVCTAASPCNIGECGLAPCLTLSKGVLCADPSVGSTACLVGRHPISGGLCTVADPCLTMARARTSDVVFNFQVTGVERVTYELGAEVAVYNPNDPRWEGVHRRGFELNGLEVRNHGAARIKPVQPISVTFGNTARVILESEANVLNLLGGSGWGAVQPLTPCNPGTTSGLQACHPGCNPTDGRDGRAYRLPVGTSYRLSNGSTATVGATPLYANLMTVYVENDAPINNPNNGMAEIILNLENHADVVGVIVAGNVSSLVTYRHEGSAPVRDVVEFSRVPNSGNGFNRYAIAIVTAAPIHDIPSWLNMRA
jgi:prepilin-type N-terminal cleavage/methylation domain-containing protein